jgi:hypothetical protein
MDTPTPKKPARKDPVAHVDVFKATINVLIPIDVMNMDSVKAASEYVKGMVGDVAAHKGHATVETKLGRAPGNIFP